jgi:sugar phosphate isomerase/epimerase
VLTSAVPLLEEAGIVLAVENHSNLTGAEMADLIAGVGSLRVRIHLDLVNPIAVFEEPVAAIRRMAPYAAACDVKDLIVESEWATGEFHRKGFRVRYAWPGEGIFPLPEALAALGDAEGVTVLPLVIEGLDETSHPAEKARQSLTVLRAMMGRLPPRPAPV